MHPEPQHPTTRRSVVHDARPVGQNRHDNRAQQVAKQYGHVRTQHKQGTEFPGYQAERKDHHCRGRQLPTRRCDCMFSVKVNTLINYKPATTDGRQT